MRSFWRRIKKTPAFLGHGLGGTIGLVILFIFRPFLPQALVIDFADFFDWLVLWWLLSLIGGLVFGQLKINKPGSPDDN